MKDRSLKYPSCIDCGKTKCASDGDRLSYVRRCAACEVGYYEAMRAANIATAAAKRRGILTPASGQNCADCGKPAHDLDHRDYRDPLVVEPVCRSCNVKRGPALWAGSAQAIAAQVRTPTTQVA